MTDSKNDPLAMVAKKITDAQALRKSAADAERQRGMEDAARRLALVDTWKRSLDEIMQQIFSDQAGTWGNASSWSR